jgi:hypothetical protein
MPIFLTAIIAVSRSEDGEGCIVEPTQEEREANPPQLERIVIYVKNACVKTKAQKPNLGMVILSPTAISNLLLTDKPSWIGMVDERGSHLANDLGHRTDIMVRARMSVYRKSTLTLAVCERPLPPPSQDTIPIMAFEFVPCHLGRKIPYQSRHLSANHNQPSLVWSSI